MIFLLILFAVILIIFYLKWRVVLGGTAKGKSQDKITNSPQYDGNVFQNSEPTTIMIKPDHQETKFSMWDAFFPPQGRVPQIALPTVKFDKRQLTNDTFSWFGHATILMKTSNTTIITDPVFHRASPIPFFGKPFTYTNPITLDDLPNIDVVILSHDHYDHLDYITIKKLGNSVKIYIVPLGVKAHLLRWGINDNNIVELDWHEQATYNNITFTLAPARHFSGRSVIDRNNTLWSSWIITSKSINIYFSGDSGYSNEFKKIKEKGPFDIAFIENGAYNPAWSQIHMFPEQSVQAALDLNAKVTIPIHWAKFNLAPHNWDDPIQRFTKAASEKKLSIATPMIGEIFTAEEITSTTWWE